MLISLEIYGADADNRRGQLQYNAELQESDNDEIRAQLEFMYEPGINNYTVFLYDEQYDREFEFEVLASDYLTPEELKGFE
jgi:hypothetical protein